MRINLPNYNCRELDLESDFPVSKEVYSEIRQFMEQTSIHRHGPDDGYPEEMLVAVFGTAFRIDGTLYRARASLLSTERENDVIVGLRISYDRAPVDFSRFPRRVRSFQVLVDAASRLFGPIDFICDALFEYGEESGYRTGLPLPIPILAPVDPGGITHVENAEFSRRNDSGIEYRIVVLNTDGSRGLVHAVHFETAGELTRTSIRQSLNRAHQISKRLLVSSGED